MQKTDTDKIEQLSHNLNRFRQSMEYSLTGLAKELSRLISNVESIQSLLFGKPCDM